MRAATSRARIIVLGVVAFLWLGLILARLVELQVLRHPEFVGRAERQQQRVVAVSPKRGILYDRNRRELAISISVESAFAVPAEVSDPARVARLLAPIVGQEAGPLAERLRSGRHFAWVARKLDAQQAERLRALNLKGIYFQREYKRFYPKRELAAHVLGFVGVDEVGLAGLEYELDQEIRGPAGRLVIFADGRRRWFHRVQDPTGAPDAAAPDSNSPDSGEGASVVLTLDETIQFIAERELAAAIARTHSRAGTLIVADPSTGEILALANWPTFNPNLPTQVPRSHHLNRAVSLAFEPGSTFKTVTLAGVLEERLTRPDEVVDCQQGAIVLAGHVIHDHKPFGLLTVREIVEESSDVGAIKLGLRLGDQRMYEHIRRWGFGQPTGVGLPAESPGLLRAPGNWSRISVGSISMGQEIAVTPLQLVAAISVVANGGEWVAPRIVREILPAKATLALAPVSSRRIIRRDTAERIRAMLRGVVRQGTGVLAQPDGYTAAGKTGTAEKIDETGTYSATDFIASFVGFAPATNPTVSVLVVLDLPVGHYHGGEVAAPVFKNVVEQVLAYLNVPADLPVLPRRPALRLERAGLSDFAPAQSKSSLWPAVAANSTTPFRLPTQWASARATDPPLTGAARGRVILESSQGVTVPNFLGRSVRAVVEECARAGLEVALVGNGVAVGQFPPPGTRLPPQSKVRVEFRPSSTIPGRTM